MIYLPQYSFFGDYQVILDIQSNVTYHCGNSETVLFGLRKDLFLNLIQESCGHYDHPIEKDSDYKLTTFERVIKDIIKKEKPLRWSLYKFYYERAVIRRRVIRKIQKYSIQVDLKQEPDKSEPTDNFRDDSELEHPNRINGKDLQENEENKHKESAYNEVDADVSKIGFLPHIKGAQPNIQNKRKPEINPIKTKYTEEYEVYYEKSLIDKNIVHRLQVKDEEIDGLSDSEFIEMSHDKKMNRRAKDLLKDYMYIVNLIYSKAFES